MAAQFSIINYQLVQRPRPDYEAANHVLIKARREMVNYERTSMSLPRRGRRRGNEDQTERSE